MPSQKIVTMVALAACAALVMTAACRREDPTADQQPADPSPSANSTADVSPTSPRPSQADATLSKPTNPSRPSPQPPRTPEGAAAIPENKTETRRTAIPPRRPASEKPLLVTSEEVDDAEADMIMRWDEFRSFSAKWTIDQVRRKGLALLREGTGIYECRKTDDGLQTRQEAQVNITIDQPEGSEIKKLFAVELILKVSDGKVVYVAHRHRKGEETVTDYTRALTDPSKDQLMGGRPLFNRLRTLETLELQPGQETVDGRDVYVFVGTGSSGLVRTRHYIDKATGIMVKRVVENDIGETTDIISFSDIQLDVEFEPDYFNYTPPEGAEVRNLVPKQSHKTVPMPMPPG